MNLVKGENWKEPKSKKDKRLETFFEEMKFSETYQKINDEKDFTDEYLEQLKKRNY